MSELSKMRAGVPYNCLDGTLQDMRDLTFANYQRFNTEPSREKRQQILTDMGVTLADNCMINPPLEITYGCHLSLGDKSFINSGAMILDNGKVTIGKQVMLGPRVQIYTAAHSLDIELRAAGEETAKPVVIADKVWIGGGAIILPGVTIGEGAVVGAGSVVTKDVEPADRVAGNPARSILKNV
ncbi:MAG: sugar O-acetyltransferase [Oceanospirillaceae bacterium]